MAMPQDVRIRLDCPDHEKFEDLAAACGTEHEPYRCWVRLLTWMAKHDQNRVDGVFHGLDANAIERRAKWAGEKGQLINALVAVRLIDTLDGEFALHDWTVHQGWVSNYNKVCDDNKQKAEKRWGDHTKHKHDDNRDNATGNASGMPPALPAAIQRNAVGNALNSSLLNSTLLNSSLPCSTDVERCKNQEVIGNGELAPNDVHGQEVPKATDKQIEAIYGAYPRHIGKAEAFKAIKKALKKRPFDTLMDAVKAFADSPAGKRDAFTPHPATWFNGERWTDDRAEWHRVEGNAPQAPPATTRSTSIAQIGTLAVDNIFNDPRDKLREAKKEVLDTAPSKLGTVVFHKLGTDDAIMDEMKKRFPLLQCVQKLNAAEQAVVAVLETQNLTIRKGTQ